MALPVKTTVEDLDTLCGYLATKPTGATVKEAKAVVDSKHLDARKLAAMKAWNLLVEESGRLKLTAAGRDYARGSDADQAAVLRRIIANCPPYSAIVERAAHQKQSSITSTDVAAHWHDHFRPEVAKSDTTLNQQAICFFHLAAGGAFGELTVGRRGAPTRVQWNSDELAAFLAADRAPAEGSDASDDSEAERPPSQEPAQMPPGKRPETTAQKSLGQAIFLAHGKNKKALEQLQKILGQFNIPYKTAVEEPNLGRPISAKVRETMKACNCAILIFSADEKLVDEKGNEIWRPSENVAHELGACSYLYGDRVVIIKEDKIVLPTNFRDLGYISFSEGELDAKAMDIVKELIGFDILRIST